MTILPPVGTLMDLVREGQERLDRTVADLTPADVVEPSALPGWTRGHLLAHLSRNADALVNLLTWAKTGTRTPMYSSPEQRATDIEAGAGRGLAEQQADLHDSARRFGETAASLSNENWSARVTSAQGREIPATEVPWMRVREVWIHLVDLRAGVGLDLLPPELAWALVRDVAGSMSSKVDFAAQLVAEGQGTVTLGSPAPVATVTGEPHQLAGWLTGRCGTEELRITGDVPELPRWL